MDEKKDVNIFSAVPEKIITDKIEEKIIQLFSIRKSYTIIHREINEKYGVSISKKNLNMIINKLIPTLRKWQNRPLNQIYPFVWLYSVNYKTREEGNYVNKTAYFVLALNLKGKKEILGLYLTDSSNFTFWVSVFSNLKKRGVEDIFIINQNGIAGLSESIKEIYTEAKYPLCIMHQLHTSLKNIDARQRQSFLIDVNQVFRSASKTAVEVALDKFESQWADAYPLIVRSWRRKWHELEEYFDYPLRIRKAIYSANMMESFHQQLGFLVKIKMIFPSEISLLKLLYIGVMNAEKRWTAPLKDWHLVLSQIGIHFAGRLDQEILL